VLPDAMPCDFIQGQGQETSKSWIFLYFLCMTAHRAKLLVIHSPSVLAFVTTQYQTIDRDSRFLLYI